MALDLIDISGQTFLSWSVIREAIAEVITFAVDAETSGARIYPHWIYETDAISLLGRVTGLMKCESGTDIGKIHAWSIGLDSAKFTKNRDGVPDVLGSSNSQWTWELKLDVWGFFENDGKKESQKAAEDEARLVAASLWRNAQKLIEQIPLLAQVRPLDFTSLAPTPFSEGSSVIVATGTLTAIANEALGI